MLKKTITKFHNDWDIEYDFQSGKAVIEGIFVSGNKTTDLTELLDTKIMQAIEDEFHLSLEPGFRVAA